MEPDVRARRSPERGAGSEKGFSLIEVLVVVAILGLIATILTLNVSNTLKKQRLETAAEQLKSQVQLAQVLSAERSVGAFVVIAAQADGSHVVWLVVDTNANNQLDFDPTNPYAGADQPIRGTELNLTRDIVLATSQTPATYWNGINFWPVVNGNFALLCDARGLTFDPSRVPPAPFESAVPLSLTHVEMATGTLRPKFRYDLTVSPLWHTTLEREMY
jgi:prepilin-type N-terminal cleavage/methylation domain-containing protein